MNSTARLNSELASYLDTRLAETVCDELVDARLYGLEVIDPLGVTEGRDGAARFICIAEGCVDALLAGPARLAAYAHDALALVTAGWSTHLDDDAAAATDPERRPVIVTVVGSDGGAIASALRDCTSGSVSEPGPVGGRLAVAFAALWSPEPIADRTDQGSLPFQALTGIS